MIDSHHAVTSILGERHVYVRLTAPDRKRMARRALGATSREPELRRELRQAVSSFVAGLDLSARPALSQGAVDQLVDLADVTTMARSGVERDAFMTREILSVPEPEAPARFAKQLHSLAVALCVIGLPEDQALELTGRVALDSIPPVRSAVLRMLACVGRSVTTSELSEGVSLPSQTVRRVAEDLAALGLVDKASGGAGRPDWWEVSRVGRAYAQVTARDAPETTLPETSVPPHIPFNLPYQVDFSGKVSGPLEAGLLGPQSRSDLTAHEKTGRLLRRSEGDRP